MEEKQPSEEEINEEVKTICGSPAFKRSERISDFLVWLIHRKLGGGQPMDFLGPVIEREFFHTRLATRPHKKNPIDPTADSIVNVTVRNLRRLLMDYYRRHGTEDRVIISIPLRRYQPHIRYRATEGPPISDEADALIAMSRLSFGPASHISKCISYIDQALALHPGHYDLLLLKSEAMVFAIFSDAWSPDAWPSLIQTFEPIVQRGDMSARAYCVLGAIFAGHDHDWQAAHGAFIIASKLNAHRPLQDVPQLLFLCSQHRFEAAFQLIADWYDEAPGSEVVVAAIIFHVYSYSWKDAERIARMALADEAIADMVMPLLAIILDATGRSQEALLIEKQTEVIMAFYRSHLGDTSDALRLYSIYKTLYDAKLTKPDNTAIAPFDMAVLAAALGDSDAVVTWLSRTVEGRDCRAMNINNLYYFQPLHSHPGFRSLVIDTLKLPLD